MLLTSPWSTDSSLMPLSKMVQLKLLPPAQKYLAGVMLLYANRSCNTGELERIQSQERDRSSLVIAKGLCFVPDQSGKAPAANGTARAPLH